MAYIFKKRNFKTSNIEIYEKKWKKKKLDDFCNNKEFKKNFS